MIDTLHLVSTQEVLPEGFDGLSRSQIASSPDRFYHRAFRISLDPKRVITLKSGPKLTHVRPCSLEVNLQNWSSLVDFLSDIERFSQPETLSIKRIDHAVDIPMPLAKIHQGLRVKSKGEHDQFDDPAVRKRSKRSLLTGFYIGEKPEKFCIYDKGYELLKREEKLKRCPGTELGVCTRVELRQFSKGIPHKKLLELGKYLKTDLFGAIEFYEFPEEMKTVRGEEFRAAALHKGFHIAFSEFNEGNNLKRTIIKQLESIPLADQLHEVHRENLRSFLGEVSRVDESRKESM